MPDQKLDLPDGYTVVPEEKWDKTPMEYIEVVPTDENGIPIPAAGKSADGDKRGAAAVKEK